MKAKAATRARLDVEMTRRGLAESRERAQRLILAGLVRVNSRPADKPDLKVDAATAIAVLPTREYASRGAYKLLAALDHFALDVGYGQIAESLRNDPRVTVMDRTNIRLVTAEAMPYRPDLVVIDTSFISLKLVLPAVIGLVATPADIIALVKPQFEVGKGNVGKGGVVRDDSLRRRALAEVLEFAVSIGLEVTGSIESPITGPAGNREFLALMRWSKG